MNQDLSENVQVLFQKAHIESLLNNRKQEEKWKAYHKDLTDTRDRLNLMLKDLSVKVLVPIGNKALFRGKLVHTNDVMIFLGDGYFTKGSVSQALEVIGRRLSHCLDTINKLGKERELLESRVSLRSEKDIFPDEGSKEIFEEYVEEKEETWKKEHRANVRDYKKRLAEIKNEQPGEIKTDEDLWKRLEMLEMEEELDDELVRLGSDTETSSESTDSDTWSDSTDQDISLQSNDKPLNLPDLNKPPGRSIMKRSSSVDNSIPLNNNDNCGEHIVINFKHSSNKPDLKQSEDFINSPYDIYTKFSAELDNKNKKLSRRVSFADCPEVKIFENKSEHYLSIDSNVLEPSLPTAFGDVVEHIAPVNLKASETRPLSKFKSARSKQEPL